MLLIIFIFFPFLKYQFMTFFLKLNHKAAVLKTFSILKSKTLLSQISIQKLNEVLF